MFLRLNSSMGGTTPAGVHFNLEVGDIIDYSHDVAEANRLIERGYGTEVLPTRVAELQATGVKVRHHPCAVGLAKKK